jgi:two-component system sensor histidine kinase PilS (NtrC family)
VACGAALLACGAALLACVAALLAGVGGHGLLAGLAATLGLGGVAVLVLRFDAARRALEHVRSDTDAVLRCLASGLLTVDLRGRITRFNPAAERILGLGSEGLADRSLAEVFGTRAPLLHQKMLRSLEDGTPIHRYEFHLAQPDDAPRPVGLSTSPMHSPRGDRVGMLVTFQDLSEVQRMQERVRRADRLAAVGQLAASIAHEIRNPLAAIANSVDMLRDELPVQGEQRRLMDLVVKESERLNRILDDFLEYASSRPLDRRLVPIRNSLEEVVDLMRRHPDIGRDIHIEVDDRADGALANIDEEQMKQVYVNLALNAFEAMAHRGRLHITVEPCPGGTLGLAEAAWIALRFQDTGPGIDPGMESTIFEPFHTTKPQGTGLGLSIAAKIVESHGGRIDATTRSEGGAEFSIYLPEVTGGVSAASAAGEAGTRAEPAAAGARPGSSREVWDPVMEEIRHVG